MKFPSLLATGMDFLTPICGTASGATLVGDLGVWNPTHSGRLCLLFLLSLKYSIYVLE